MFIFHQQISGQNNYIKIANESMKYVAKLKHPRMTMKKSQVLGNLRNLGNESLLKF
jgi:hypothetical protein